MLERIQKLNKMIEFMVRQDIWNLKELKKILLNQQK